MDLKNTLDNLKNELNDALEKADLEEKIKAGAEEIKDRIAESGIEEKVKKGAAEMKDRIAESGIEEKVKKSAAEMKDRIAESGIEEKVKKGAAEMKDRIAESGIEEKVRESAAEIKTRVDEFLEKTDIDEKLKAGFEALKDMIVKELLVGRGEDRIKAGFIGEVGSSNYQVYETEEKVLRAAGRASAETGYGISTHTGRGTMYREQLSFFEEEGADLSHVIIGHQDVYPRLEERMEAYEYIFSKGAGVEFDCFGKRGFFEIELDMDYGQKFPYDAERAKMIKYFVDHGYIRQIYISCDTDGRTLLKKWGGWGYSHLLTSGLPLLRKTGLTWEEIDQITRINPKEFLRVRK